MNHVNFGLYFIYKMHDMHTNFLSKCYQAETASSERIDLTFELDAISLKYNIKIIIVLYGKSNSG